MKTLALVVLTVASSAAAQGARLAVHPLVLREMTPAQQEKVQAQFDVMLARVPDIRLAGSSSVEEALANPAGKGCETRDDCLRHLAQATESLYAAYVRIRPDPLGIQVVLNARVLRADGSMVNSVTLAQPLDEGADPTDSARELLVKLLDELALGTLSPTLSIEPVAMASAPVVFDQPSAGSARRPIGFALLGTGIGALAAGGVLAALAVSGRSRLTPDANGAVPRSQANRAQDVAREAQSATVLIPVGAVIAVVGSALAWWPARAQQPIALSLIARPGEAGLQVGGRFP